jgi:N-methylhydantoinase B
VEGDGVTDDDIPVEVAVTVDGGTVEVDFAGTADQVTSDVNAPLTVARSAVYFVIRCITDPEIPSNHGCYGPVAVDTPEESLLNPDPLAAVIGGNVETSQRVTDVVFVALADAVPERVPAGGQRTMNNAVMGDADVAYYETVGGGAGANPDSDGLSGVQVGMTNTLNTPVEALEAAYPVRVERYALREGSGGDGRYRDGDGLVRSLRVETDATVSLLTERRRHPPRGIAGGDDGQVGNNRIDGESVGAKVTREADAGTTVTVETPGGGGRGTPIDGGHGTPSSDGTGMAAESTDEDDPRE